MRRLISLIVSLILMAAFYLYAVTREDEETKHTEQWVVDAPQEALTANGGVVSTDGVTLVRAMGAPIPLPSTLSAGQVSDESWHGYYVRRLTATDGQTRVDAVRPLSAAPILRGNTLTFAPGGLSLFGFPLLEAQDESLHYAFLVTQEAAVLIETPLDQFETLLKSMQLTAD